MFKTIDTYIAKFMVTDDSSLRTHWKLDDYYIYDFKIKWYWWPLVIIRILLLILFGIIKLPFVICKEKLKSNNKSA